jgi:hypothetical protein
MALEVGDYMIFGTLMFIINIVNIIVFNSSYSTIPVVGTLIKWIIILLTNTTLLITIINRIMNSNKSDTDDFTLDEQNYNTVIVIASLIFIVLWILILIISEDILEDYYLGLII